MGDRYWRLAICHGAGLGLGVLLWATLANPFSLDEFCARNRPTWVIPLLERPRYTAVEGHVFLLILGVATAVYLGAARLARGQRGRLAVLALLAVVPVGLVVVLLPAYPLLSSDIFKYIFDGRILAVYGENPFLHVPAEHPDDRFYDLVYWKAVVNAHGPLWRVAEATAALAGGENCQAAVMAMKIWPMLAYLGTIAFLYRVLRSWQPDRAVWGTMLYAWNPVVALEALQNGHNDVVAALPAVGAVWCAARGRYRLAFPVLAVAVLVKPLAVVLGPVLLAAVIRQRRKAAESRASGADAPAVAPVDLAVGVLLAGAIVLAAYLPFWSGAATFQGLSRGNLFSTSPAKVLLELLQGAGVPLEAALSIASGAAGAIFLAMLLLLVAAVATGRLMVVDGALGVIFAYLLVGAQWFNPWYMLWLAPLAVLTSHVQPRVMALAFIGLAPIVYAMRDSWPVVLIVFLPIALLATCWRAWLGWSWSAFPDTVGSTRGSVSQPSPVWRTAGSDQGHA